MPRQRSVILRAVGALGLVAVLVASVYALIGNPLDPFDNRSFSPAGWASADPDARARMSRDLVNHYLAPGTTEQQVVALLGKPGTIVNADGRNHVYGVRAYVYPIGSLSSEMDDTFVYVHLDGNDRVLQAEIDGY